MPRTSVFRFGKSQAVRIPAELAYANIDIDLEVSRVGDVITIFPVRNNLADMVDLLRRMPKPRRVGKRQRCRPVRHLRSTATPTTSDDAS